MAVISLYHIGDHVKAAKWAKFPDDFYVVAEAKLDEWLVDHPLVADYRWSFKKPDKKSKTGRARRFEGTNPRQCIYLSRVVWEIANGPVPNGMTVDHRNLDSLDDRTENLRLASQAEQNRNQGKKTVCFATSLYKGVRLHSYGSVNAKHFHATISPEDYPSCCLGYYRTQEEAALAYNCAAELRYLEFANLNDIPLDSIPPARQLEIRSIVERKLRDRGLISSDN